MIAAAREGSSRLGNGASRPLGHRAHDDGVEDGDEYDGEWFNNENGQYERFE